MTLGDNITDDDNLKDSSNIDNSEMLLLVDGYKNSNTESLSTNNKWNILFVDNDESVYSATKKVLEQVVFEENGIELLYANSFEKAKEILKFEEDICLVFIDVLMENDHVGLEILKYIREDLANRLIRIVIRTDQPVLAPERKLIEDYDINGYLLKNEITTDKLYVNTITSLKEFMDLEYIYKTRKRMQTLLNSTEAYISKSSIDDFQEVIMEQLCSLISKYKNESKEDIKGFIALKFESDYIVETSSKNYQNIYGKNIMQILDQEEIQIFLYAKNNPNNSVFKQNTLVYYFYNKLEYDKLIFIKKKKVFTGIQKEIFDIFLNNVCMASNNISLRREIHLVQKEMIYKLGEILELRSKETSFHVKRVAEYSALLGEKYGLSIIECDLLRLAAPLHDVGKVGVSDLILNKPGKLTEKEFSIVKTHSNLGYEMLKNSNSEVMKAAAIIALQHHERYDGKGYPNGMKGEEIHIYARIVAIADVFDALETQRIYKSAWDMKEILWLFEKERGKQFDDKLVQLLFENLHEFIKIGDLTKDEL